MPKLIKFEQNLCAPCQMVSQFLDSKNVDYDVINVENNPDIAGEYGIMSVPVTILLDDNGNEVRRSQGFKPNELEELISQL